MVLDVIAAILLTFVPAIELRGSLPLAILAAQKNNIILFPVITLIFLLNILLIFIVFFFLDKIHEKVMEWKWYRKSFEFYLRKIQKKIDKVERQTGIFPFIILMLFVAVPLPGTGAYTGTLIAWILGLERKKSIFAISSGVIIAGLLILVGTFSLISLL